MRFSVLLVILLAFVTPSVWAQETDALWANNRLVAKFAVELKDNPFELKSGIVAFGIPEVDALNRQYACTKVELVRGGGTIRNVVLIFANPIDVVSVKNAYLATKKFAYIEPDYVGRGGGMEMCPPELTPNDALYNRQWGLKNDGTFTQSTAVSGNDIKAEAAWDLTKGSSSITLCIIDSGMKLNHPDVAGRIWVNPRETANNGRDDDGNGLIDDVNGWDYANGDKDPTDDHGHGTNVAGIAGTTGNNAIGYAGVDWNCKLMIIKGLNSSNSGFYSWWQNGIYYAVDNGAKVINMSLVGISSSTALEDAINYAWSKGVLVVACMGNDNTGIAMYPAGYSNLVAVGSVNPNGKRSAPFFWGTSSGSNYGSHIDVVAPGNFIFGLNFSSDTNYNTYWGGTSQATPHVAGLATLMLSRNPNLTVTRLRDLIRSTCDDQTGDPTEDVRGFDNYFGFGRVNALKAVQAAIVSSTENLSAQLSIYPNPNAGVFTVESSAILRGLVDIEVYNATGQLTYQKSVENAGDYFNATVDLSAQAAKGLYFVHLKNENKILTQKIFIQ